MVKILISRILKYQKQKEKLKFLSLMLHKELNPPIFKFNFDNILKHRNILRNKKYASISAKSQSWQKKSSDDTSKSIDLDSSESKSSKLDFLEYYQISAKQNFTADSPTTTKPRHKIKLIGTNGPVDLNFKSNVYKSYLNYSSINPFQSNYDVVSKKKNTELVSDSTYRFNRANSSVSLLSQSLEYKKFSSSADCAKEPRKEKMLASAGEICSTANNEAGNVVVLKSLTANSRLNENMDVIEIKSARGGDTAKLSQTNKKNQSRAMHKSSSATNNQFLNYRNDECLTNESSQNVKKAKNLNYENSHMSFKLRNKENNRAQSSQQEKFSGTLRNKNGPENYLETHKLELIRKWVEHVNSVQAVNGKWGETINKILFYD